MSMVTINVEERELAFLADEARIRGIAVDLLIESYLAESIERRRRFLESKTRVLAENAELYQRLAR